MKTQTPKICEVCHEVFTPDPRVGQRQRVCGKSNCKRERKRRAQQSWLQRNPYYFKGRYSYLKEWLQTHPDYLKNYRAQRRAFPSHPAEVDIQDKLTSSKTNELLKTLRQIFDIQDKLTSMISMGRAHLMLLNTLIYKTS